MFVSIDFNLTDIHRLITTLTKFNSSFSQKMKEYSNKHSSEQQNPQARYLERLMDQNYQKHDTMNNQKKFDHLISKEQYQQSQESFYQDDQCKNKGKPNQKKKRRSAITEERVKSYQDTKRINKHEEKAHLLANYKRQPVHQKELLDRLVASVFVAKGYSLQYVKEAARTTITQGKYQSCITSIMKYTIRQFCSIMASTFGTGVKVYTLQEEVLLKVVMANCQKYFTVKQQQTIYKIVNIVYACNNLPIFQDEILILYDKINKYLQMRRQELKQKRVKFQNQSTQSTQSRTKRRRLTIIDQDPIVQSKAPSMPPQKQITSIILNNSVINQNYYEKVQKTVHNHHVRESNRSNLQSEEAQSTNLSQYSDNTSKPKRFDFLKNSQKLKPRRN